MPILRGSCNKQSTRENSKNTILFSSLRLSILPLASHSVNSLHPLHIHQTPSSRVPSMLALLRQTWLTEIIA